MSKITRTITVTIADVIAFNTESEKLETLHPVNRGKLSHAEIVKNWKFDGFIPCKIKSVRYDETLYGMEESKFVTLAKKVDTRSPETRGTITKEVSSFVAACMIFDGEKVAEKHVALPKKMNVDEANKWCRKRYDSVIKVKSVGEVTGLYYMTVDDFISNSEVMPARVQA